LTMLIDDGDAAKIAIEDEAKDRNLAFCEECSIYLELAEENIFGRRVFICPGCGKTLIEGSQSDYKNER